MAASFKKSDNYSSKNEINEEVLHVLRSLFGNLLHTDVIKSVGLNCNWDLQSTCNILADISNTVVTDHGQLESKNKTVNIVQRQSNDDDNQDVIVENEIFDDVNDSKFIPQYGTKFSSRPKGISYAEKSIGRGNMIPRVTRVKSQPKQAQNKSKRELEFERVKQLILTGAKVLVLLRGPPGSGKSYLAKMLIEQTMQEDYRRFVFSTDDYFVINGVYQFNPTSVSEAHSWNHSRVREVMQMGISPVVVDNTNTQMWEMRPYLHFAVTFGYAVELLEPFTSWLYNPQELARRNCHSIPKAKIAEILERYDRKITTEQLFATYKLKYHPSKQPPQPRLYPPMRKNRPIKFDIPNSIRRDTPSLNPNAPKQKRLRKRNLHTKSQGTSVPEPFEMISSNSVLNMQSLEYSTSSESDEELSSSNNVGYKGPDILSSDIKECTEYVLVMPDSTRIYQKSHIDTENKNEQNIDLINFNDSESTIKNPTVTEDLINLNSNEDKPENNQDMMPQPVMEQFSSLNISKPQVYNQQEGQIVSTPNLYPKLDLSAWGLSENPLISWESDKILKQEICKYESPQPQRNFMKNMYPSYVDSTTNTSSSDFNLMKQDRIGPEHGRIVNTCIRDINEYTLIAAPKPSLITVFDKSTMTAEEDLLQPLTSSAESEKHAKVFSALVNLFPQTPPDDLREIYDKCKGDINWTVDLLLDSNMVSVSQNIVPKNKNILDTSENKRVNDITENISNETEHNTSENSEDSTKMCSPESKKTSNRFKNKVPFSDESLELKRQIEEHVKINDAHYSEHLLNIRRKKYGEVEPCQSGIALVNKISESSPQFTTQDICSEDDESEEEIIEINVGMDFIQKMECSLEVGNVDYPEGIQPILNIPASLLKQFHAYWLESVYQQMEAYAKVVEKMVSEDEELARRLQQEEESAVDNKEPVVPDLQEIMDMEIALAIYRSDQKQLKAETPDDLATRIKRQKLFETFPKLDSNTLTEILQAHDNCFEQTMDVLMSSVGDTTTVNIDKSGIDNLQKQKELIENAKKEYLEVKQANSIKKESNEAVPQEDEYCETNSAEDYREAAAHHLKMRQICFNKAKTALQKKWTQVATYYLDMAKLHKQKYELANGRAASAFLNSHFYNHQNSNTLDLHYLYVKEAEQALAMYLDSRILKLKESKKQKESIYIITGRGKHSKNGISQIKPAIQRKLRERKIDFAEVNPGLLKVRITRHSIMTNDLKN